MFMFDVMFVILINMSNAPNEVKQTNKMKHNNQCYFEQNEFQLLNCWKNGGCSFHFVQFITYVHRTMSDDQMRLLTFSFLIEYGRHQINRKLLCQLKK